MRRWESKVIGVITLFGHHEEFLKADVSSIKSSTYCISFFHHLRLLNTTKGTLPSRTGNPLIA